VAAIAELEEMADKMKAEGLTHFTLADAA